jgi:hypothetical protein
MLSGARHLLFLIENKQKQILRFAQDDRIGVFQYQGRPESPLRSSFANSPREVSGLEAP